MSQETVEIVRRGYEAYARGDMDAAVAPFDPEIEIYDHDIPDAGVYRGVEGLFRWQADWRAVGRAGAGTRRSSSTPVSGSSPSFAFMQRVARAALMWNAWTVRCGRCETASACDLTTTAARNRPSKQRGCGSS
jgi:hypothetical protein